MSTKYHMNVNVKSAFANVCSAFDSIPSITESDAPDLGSLVSAFIKGENALRVDGPIAVAKQVFAHAVRIAAEKFGKNESEFCRAIARGENPNAVGKELESAATAVKNRIRVYRILAGIFAERMPRNDKERRYALAHAQGNVVGFKLPDKLPSTSILRFRDPESEIPNIVLTYVKANAKRSTLLNAVDYVDALEKRGWTIDRTTLFDDSGTINVDALTAPASDSADAPAESADDSDASADPLDKCVAAFERAFGLCSALNIDPQTALDALAARVARPADTASAAA
jgi:hypothetical protein